LYEVLGIEVDLGECIIVGSLQLFPLVTTTTTSPPYLTGPEASASGLLQVTELDPPQVPFLAVANLADVPVLLVEGELLVGGDQDRTMNVTVLCPPGETTVVPVSCVEAGRWGARRPMASTGRHAPGSLRARKTRSQGSRAGTPHDRLSDQAQVWESVDRVARSRSVESETAALEDVNRDADDRIGDELARITPRSGQTGVICLLGDHVVGMDLFDRPETLRHYLPGIVAGHALDAVDGTVAVDPVRAIAEFLARVDAADREGGDGVGLGEEIVFRGGVSGVGLTYGGTLVHVAAFPAG
jgi:hypothetical protein